MPVLGTSEASSAFTSAAGVSCRCRWAASITRLARDDALRAPLAFSHRTSRDPGRIRRPVPRLFN
ncbi:MAG: hypothetical protein AVDCRST_MAG01-01-274 [uncultured Rubrobacteraceae bacterium]|uniref:Uncharacterized protein n=1 Tax=uncultured Rubrobacteraceae bacterium TaxID=349277 RepID=A0A6J4NFD7_9ACTN|nr:MAG: hypothetical protein AVDCRST_MAG01-01-274 [uncultured Rubrobacteraceae bacterium]